MHSPSYHAGPTQNSGLYDCEHGCGFTGTYDRVLKHETSCPLRYQQKLPHPLYGVHSLSETAKQARRAAGAHFPWPIGSEQQKDWEESAGGFGQIWLVGVDGIG